MPHLLFSRSSQHWFKFSLKSSTTKIGRSEACDIVLGDPAVSREHAALYWIEGQFWLKKTGRAPLLVNGREVESQVLRGGDQVQIGPWAAEYFPEGESHPAEEPTVLDEAGEKTQAILSPSGRLLLQNLVLEILEPGKNPREFPLQEPILNIGAAEKNEIILSDPTVSSRHLKLVRQGETTTVFDLGSTNGTWVNGVKIREAEVEPGFQLKLGQTVIRFLQKETLEAPRPIATEEFFGLVGASKGMQSLYGLLSKIAPIDATVLILGESGTGKELVARALHRLSRRAKGPFVVINCGAISPELVESELFGHEKGAFTGALRQHEGAVGQAKGGTLFLDEIGELPLDLQPKLLRLLENRTFRRVGGMEELNADIRMIAATHRDLNRAVQEKSFREDLFFRLFVLPIVLPALRERREDIPLLSKSFLKDFSGNGSLKELSEAAMEKLSEHAFHGNVRELKNTLLRAFILAEGEQIGAEDLCFNQELGFGGKSLAADFRVERLEDMEKRLVLRALEIHRWNKTKAAEALGVAKSTLFAKIKLYGIEAPESPG